jgi:transcriptional regulator with XRE-family HTH domain
MNTHTNHNDLKKDFGELFNQRSDEKEIKHDSLMLMAAFLSEIEYIQEKNGMSRKELAQKIKISPSYLTQVFRSQKPLNFLTLARIKRALNIRFEVKALHKYELAKENIIQAPIIQLNLMVNQFIIAENNDSSDIQYMGELVTSSFIESGVSQEIKSPERLN